jgi:hypothetical protein
VHVVAPDVGDEVGPWARRAAHARERPFAAADLDGAWLATATGDPAVDARCSSAARPPGVGELGRRPRNCSFTLMSVGAAGRPRGHDRHRGPQPGARRTCWSASTELGPSTSVLLDLLSEPGKRCGAGRSRGDADWQRPRFRHRST